VNALLTKPMNTDIKTLTEEWIEKEARKRKQVPIAVFTIITVHVVLFLSLLGSSGCKQKTETAASSTAEQMREVEYTAAITASTNSTRQRAALHPVEEPVMAEPMAEPPRSVAKLDTAVQDKPVTLASASAEPGAKIYVVKPGDNLLKIAKANGTTPKALKSANGLKTDIIRVGQKLRIG
jgi:LysM repeat protein